MKLLFLFLSTMALSNNSGSQKTGNTIPQNVVASFNTKYAGAHISNWKVDKDGFAATFKLDSKKCCAFYSTGGDWLRTETKIRWPWRLPVAVKNALYTGEYAAWYVDEIKEVEMPGAHQFLVHVDNANVLKVADPYLFKDDYQLYYNESGELLKKEKLP